MKSFPYIIASAIKTSLCTTLMSLPTIQTIMANSIFTNPGFENNAPAYNTTYNSFKTPIAGWSIIGSSGEAGAMYYT